MIESTGNLESSEPGRAGSAHVGHDYIYVIYVLSLMPLSWTSRVQSRRCKVRGHSSEHILVHPLGSRHCGCGRGI